MKTLTKSFAKRFISILLSFMMIISLCAVSFTSVTAAEVDLAPTGWDSNSKVYVQSSIYGWDNENYKMIVESSGHLYFQFLDVPTTDDLYFRLYDSSANAYFAPTDGDAYNYQIYPNYDETYYYYGAYNTNHRNWKIAMSNYASKGKTVDVFIDFYGSDNYGHNNIFQVRISGADSSGSGGSTTEQTVFFFKVDTWTEVNMYSWDSSNKALTGAWPGTEIKTIVTDTDGNQWYQVNVPAGAVGIIFNNNGSSQTVDIKDFSNLNGFTLSTVSNGKYNVIKTDKVEVSTGGDTPVTNPKIWVDVDGDVATTTDRIYPITGRADYTNVYFMFLPAGVDASDVTFVSDGEVSFAGSTITPDGVKLNISSKLNGNGSLTLPAYYGSKAMYVHQSANVMSIHTTTEQDVPQGTGYGKTNSSVADKDYEGYHKDDYESENDSAETGTDTQFITVYTPEGEAKISEGILDKIKGRGNSSWEASAKIIGKYAFNITLGSKVKLLEGSEKSKKYCLVSFNADEARIRNMIMYELAEFMGVEYTPSYAPVDFYNNGQYIGSYLLTDKVEIGDPLVNLKNANGDEVNLDDENKAYYGKAKDEQRASSTGNLDQTSGPGYYKYYDYSSVTTTPLDSSIYQDTGFLLEFELDERFDQEVAGFISTQGQTIVSKYPEYPDKQQIEFIMGVWNRAEEKMYDPNATYEELNAVIDVESFAKMYLIQELSKNLDASATSYYVYYQGGKLHAGVAWDYDWTLGQYGTTQYNGIMDRRLENSTYSDDTTVFEDPKGWWASIRLIYKKSKNYSNVPYSAQAALCQNTAFQNVIRAEWNELFYDEVKSYVTDTKITTAGDATALTGKIKDFYDLIHQSTKLDEIKWQIIEKDPFVADNWGSVNTSSGAGAKAHDAQHNYATVYLNNWIYERVEWLNQTFNSDSFTIAQPTLEADKESYEKGDTIRLTANCNTSGELTYYLFKDGVLVSGAELTSSTGTVTFEIPAESYGTAEYSVQVLSENTTYANATASVTVKVEGFELILNVTAPTEPVYWNDGVVIKGTTNADEDYDVTYKLYLDDEDCSDLMRPINGEFGFRYIYDMIGQTVVWEVVATVTVDNIEHTASQTGTVSFIDYNNTITISAPAKVQAGENIVVNADCTHGEVSTSVTYYLYDAETDEIADTNATGKFTVNTTLDDTGFRSYYVKCVAVETDWYTKIEHEYTATSSVVTVEIINNTTFFITLSKSPVAQQGEEFTITATPHNNANTDITYTLTGTDGTKLTSDDGVFTFVPIKFGEVKYTVTAKNNSVLDESASASIKVNFAANTGKYSVKIFFKTASAYGYTPRLTVNGVNGKSMNKEAAVLAENSSNTSKYYWYSYELASDVAYGTEYKINIRGSRNSFYDVTFTLYAAAGDNQVIDGVCCYYFAVENLNKRGSDIVNISAMEEYKRNWCESAMNMIYDEGVDPSLVAPTATKVSYAAFGDVNGDGAVNIKDATAIQRCVAGLEKMGLLQNIVSDMDDDGNITIKDATAIQKKLVALL